eukprot:GHVT01048495.1.p1 GENE.GHVT01048495.1~~GHVT01048495.1.p1  ORF type:complete len:215 (+),score=4.50 GHVT01048495.1:50-646(+)
MGTFTFMEGQRPSAYVGVFPKPSAFTSQATNLYGKFGMSTFSIGCRFPTLYFNYPSRIVAGYFRDDKSFCIISRFVNWYIQRRTASSVVVCPFVIANKDQNIITASAVINLPCSCFMRARRPKRKQFLVTFDTPTINCRNQGANIMAVFKFLSSSPPGVELHSLGITGDPTDKPWTGTFPPGKGGLPRIPSHIYSMQL